MLAVTGLPDVTSHINPYTVYFIASFYVLNLICLWKMPFYHFTIQNKFALWKMGPAFFQHRNEGKVIYDPIMLKAKITTVKTVRLQGRGSHSTLPLVAGRRLCTSPGRVYWTAQAGLSLSEMSSGCSRCCQLLKRCSPCSCCCWGNALRLLISGSGQKWGEGFQMIYENLGVTIYLDDTY